MNYNNLRGLQTAGRRETSIRGFLTAIPFGILVGVAFFLLAPVLNATTSNAAATATPTRPAPLAADSFKAPPASPTPDPTATVSSQPTVPARPAAAAGCRFWDEVGAQDVGSELCVQGEYLHSFKRDDGTYVMVFSENPGSFQVWSPGKSFESCLSGFPDTCVLAKGWVMTSGVRPMILLGKRGKLEPCP